MDRTAITQLLQEARDGDSDAFDKLFPLVYEELRAMSSRRLAQQRASHTLQPTALVHEVYLKLIDSNAARVRDRTHFFALAANIMRQILVDHARRREAAKRGGNWLKVTLEKAESPAKDADVDVLALDEALTKLSELEERKGRVVELRFFGGLSMDEVADSLGISLRSVEADWYMARAWLRRELSRQ